MPRDISFQWIHVAGRCSDRSRRLHAPLCVHPPLPDVQREPTEPTRVSRRLRVRRRLHCRHDSVLGLQRVHRFHQYDVCPAGKLRLHTNERHV